MTVQKQRIAKPQTLFKVQNQEVMNENLYFHQKTRSINTSELNFH